MQELLKRLNKEYGDVIVSAKHFAQKERKIIPWSPALDAGIGGILEGTWTLVSGAPKCGKTTSILDFCKSAQAAGKYIVYDAPEARLKERDLAGIENLDQDKLYLIMSTEEKNLTAEEHLSLCMEFLKNTKEIVLVIDSTSALCAAGEMTADITSSARNSGPKLLATFCRQMASVVPIRRHIVIMIQHLIANTSGYGAKFMEDGGNKIQYQCDYKLRCKGVKRWNEGEKDDEVSKQIGQKVEWEVLTSALKAPGQRVEGWIRYGHGIDKEIEVASLAADLGVIDKGGAWYTINCLTGTPHEALNGTKIQGKEKLRAFLVEHPEITKLITDKIVELV
jgi:recombination protein RecA